VRGDSGGGPVVDPAGGAVGGRPRGRPVPLGGCGAGQVPELVESYVQLDLGGLPGDVGQAGADEPPAALGRQLHRDLQHGRICAAA
jgi:hypothetical protein